MNEFFVNRWITGYSLPPVDTNNDLTNVGGGYQNGVLTVQVNKRFEPTLFFQTLCSHIHWLSGGARVI